MLDVCGMYADCLQMYAEVPPIELLLNFPLTSQSTLNLWLDLYHLPDVEAQWYRDRKMRVV